jgi:uncharacterized protein YbjT (DUF2867 family)
MALYWADPKGGQTCGLPNTFMVSVSSEHDTGGDTMSRVLVTGGTGALGRELVPRLLGAGYTVRVMSRRAAKPGEDANVEWAQASLENGTGMAEAVAGVNAVLHAASSSVKRTVDVDGTARLLDQARGAGVEHFIYISIVGIDQIGFSYYQNKLAAERLIEASGLPYSILRATQFHYLVDTLLHISSRLPVALVPTDWQFQSIGASEVAEHLVAALKSGARGHMPDIGGPEVLRLDEMAREWMAARGKRRPMLHIPVPGKLSAGFRRGLNTTPENRVGTITWAEWLAARYGKRVGRDPASAADQVVEGNISA